MPIERPNPDDLLEQVQAEEARQHRGRLKVFLGASAGVGKTYEMLSQGRIQKQRGIDVVVGYAESHGRKETDALLEGLEILPRKSIEHRGVILQEFDLDAILERKPSLVLVDELAHTNVVGMRHPKRYQDVEELLAAGIDVYTTVNVQHLESLNDVVAQITGVMVRETIPDSILDRADEIELVDIPPKDLRQRLQEGKVYVPERVDQALGGFFREGNLIALRELALRRTADRVDAQMQSYRAEQRVERPWPTKERILVCIAPNRLGARVVRVAARMGSASHADMLALFVESDRQVQRPQEHLDLAQSSLRLAESLGMETVSTSGHDIVEEILRVARQRNASLILVGKPIKARWREIMQGSVVDELVRRSGDIDVHVITGEGEVAEKQTRTSGPPAIEWKNYAAVLALTALATAVSLPLRPHLSPATLVMIYLLVAALVSARFGPMESTVACILSVGAFDFFCVPPYYTFGVSDTQYLVTFLIMLVVSLFISGLGQRLRRQAETSQAREHRAAVLYKLSRELARTRSRSEIAEIGAREIGDVFRCDVVILLTEDSGELQPVVASQGGWEKEQTDRGAAAWARDKKEEAGSGTDTLPNAKALYVPLIAPRGVVGVIGAKLEGALDSQQMGLLETFANGLALAIERTILARESHTARLVAESERMRNVLLNSVSHDLRTPLTAIAGAASSMAEGKGDPRELSATIVEQADRMNRHVQNLLDMTRLEASTINPQFEWHSIEELIGSALSQTEKSLGERRVRTFIPPGLPLVRVDGTLVEKALVNLLENVSRYTPDQSDVDVRVSVPPGKLRIAVEDRGPGIPKGEEEKIFEKFYQPAGGQDRGFGLGLAICRSVAEAHGGKAFAENRAGGGARIVLELSLTGEAPEVPFE